MAKNVFKSNVLGTVSMLVVVLVVGCSSSKTNYQREYTRVWKELIKTEAWKNSLLAKNDEKPSNGVEYYASNTETGIVEDPFSSKMNMEVLFDKRFYSLTSRAYVKIISEAENADRRLKAEYNRWNSRQQNPNLKKDKAFKKDYEMANKKYHAHRQMLEGLKSWNIFSEFRSNDLDFFRAENRNEIQKMYQNGSTEDSMINYLVYRLADLYHYEDQ
jgi:hypothetical protein